MKRVFNCLICFCAVLVVAFGFSACAGQKNEEAVNLVTIDANSVGLNPDIDYYVVPEPAASAKVKAISDLNFAGDLQELYGGENGYPQAVVVVKNNLIGTDIIYRFTNALASTGEWLMSDEVSVETIVNAIQSHLTDGLEPSIKVQNLTKSVIKNCGINFVPASDAKGDILSFMEKLNSISDSSFGMPSDEFFDGVAGEQYSQKIKVYAPDGAPALGLAKLMAESSLVNTEYEVVNANVVQTLVSGSSPKADICVLPVNVAVKLLGDGANYRLLGTLTHGNLYLLSKENVAINRANLENLKGKTVGVVNLAAVPGLTFKLILKNYGIQYVNPYNA